MKKVILKFLIILMLLSFANSGRTQVDEHDSITPRPYPPLREADMKWVKRVWRVIDMRDKFNKPVYFPTSTSFVQKSFTQVLLYAFKYGSLKAYKPVDDEFTIPYTYEQFVADMTDTLRIRMKKKTLPYDTYDSVVIKPFDPASVVKLRLKEDWFYNTYYSKMQVRIIGICPIVDVYDADTLTLKGAKPLFWIYYPQARKVLANAFVCNSPDNKKLISYDSLFGRRMFTSYIYKSSNAFDKKISESYKGIDALIESERIKEDIYRFKDDMWDY